MIHYNNFLNNEIPDKSVQLIIADPPYFEVKGEFDFIWESFEDYLKDVDKWAKECKRVLADNGTLFWWGDARKIAYSQIVLDKYFELIGAPVWEKKECQTKRQDFEQSRVFAPITERILMYSNETDDETGLMSIYSSDECFSQIKSYLNQQKKESNLTSKDFNRLFSDYTNKKGCTDRSVIEHYWQRSQWCFPTKDIYENVLQTTGFFQRSYEDLRKEYEDLRKEYEDLRKEYEELRRPFNNILKLTDVLKFSQESQHSKKWKHDTRKPEKLTTALIECCSRVGDTVFVPFAGSGTECAMAVRSGRKYIGFEIDKNHFDTASKRVKLEESTPKLFYS